MGFSPSSGVRGRKPVGEQTAVLFPAFWGLVLAEVAVLTVDANNGLTRIFMMTVERGFQLACRHFVVPVAEKFRSIP